MYKSGSHTVCRHRGTAPCSGALPQTQSISSWAHQKSKPRPTRNILSRNWCFKISVVSHMHIGLRALSREAPAREGQRLCSEAVPVPTLLHLFSSSLSMFFLQ